MKFLLNIFIDYNDSTYLDISKDKNNNFIIEIYTKPSSSFSDSLSKENLSELLNQEKVYSQYQLQPDNEDIIEFLNNLIECNNVFTNLNEIIIYSNNVDNVNTFLTNNTDLDNLSTVFCYDTSFKNLDKDKTNNLLEKHNNCSLLIKNNNLAIKKDEFKRTIDEIDDICSRVQKYEFSPLEKIMYVYDIVRSRVYKKENSSSSYYSSRDLSKALLGDDIVCVGFASIFSAVLDRLGFDETLVRLRGEEKGHVRNQVVVNDEKYNVYGYYNFDPTWDCKLNGSDKSYVYQYRFFAKTDVELKDSHKIKDFKNKIFDEDYVKELEQKLLTEGLSGLNSEDIQVINGLSRKIGDNFKLPGSLVFPIINIPQSMNCGYYTVEDAIYELYNYFKIFNTQIPYKTLLEVLFTVRKIEYYEDPMNYDFCLDSIIATLRQSNWINHDYEKLSGDKKLLATIFKADVYKDYQKKISSIQNDFADEHEQEMGIVKLSRILRTYIDNNTK